MYVFGCRLSLFRLCGSDFGITAVDDITNGILIIIIIEFLTSQLQLGNIIITIIIIFIIIVGCTRWHSWLRHCAISQKAEGSFSDEVTGIFR
jgi:hypothetical protein